MILSNDWTKEAMMDLNTGRKFWRDLSKAEMFEVVQAKISDAAYQMEKLLEMGFDLEEIVEQSLAYADAES